MTAQTEQTAERPRLNAPPGACDTHMHIYGTEARFPFVPTAPIKVPEAPVEAYLAMLARVGVQRAVVVQPIGYGTDNRCTLEALQVMGSRARGIATVDTTVTDAELQRLTDAGIRGVRFHMLPGGVLPWAIMQELAARVNNFGWHVQLQLDGHTLPDHEALLKRLPCSLVVDHVGRFEGTGDTDHPGFRSLLSLVDGGRCWVKLSAPYITSQSGPPHFTDVGQLANALVRAAPERMLWASNWPHPGMTDADLTEEAMLLDTLLEWVDDDATRNRILADNPAVLYGFE